MLKAAIEKITEIATPIIRDVEGRTFAIDRDGVDEIRPKVDRPEPITLNSLDSLVKMVKTEASEDTDLLYITIPSYHSVSCFGRFDREDRGNRQGYYEVELTDVPGWKERAELPFEEAQIALRTRFQHTADTDYALKLLSEITTGAKMTLNDNGVATSVVTQKGVALQANQAIRPIITLKPYRTFQEVEQPASQFLIRVSERGIAFIEADGGMWKLEARQTIKRYLEEALHQEVQDGKVIVAL